ncbi:MAG: lysine--tRNA ligase [Kiritimatiellae bacterium]|nr:lysine--tRNA ligase [Kiritimatiellia bacterium]
MSEETTEKQASNQPVRNVTSNEYRDQRIANLKKLEELGYDPFGRAYERTRLSEIRANFEEEKIVRAAGRMMTVRRMGKAAFANIMDGTDSFQVFFKKDLLDETAYQAFKYVDIGDFIGVEGRLFRTRTGEMTIEVHSWNFLSKAIQQPPEKFHGLQDTEDKYRKRYLDLMTNKESRDRFIKRIRILAEIRNFLQSRGFLEVETPILQGQAGGAAAKPFFTHYNALNRDMVLRIAPELYLKRLIVGGLDKVFELGKDFRNEGIDRTHNPEFTVLEIYEAYGDRTSMKNIIEGLLPHLCEKVIGTMEIPYGTEGEVLNFRPPYREVAYSDLVRELMGDDWFSLPLEEAKVKAKEKGLDEIDPAWDHLLLTHEVYDKLIEKTLRQPTFVTRIPHQFVPLARTCLDDPSLVDVFEFVVAGKELCPGYTEQNNPFEQRKAFENQAGEDTEKIDEDFILALEHGMPPTGGLGLGIDRLVMMLTGTEVIRDVILFPQMKDNR